MSGSSAETFAPDDARYMDRALELARGSLGKAAPNPSVGCVIVRDGVVVGEGATARGGRPHAEEVALAAAGEKAKGATAYISLEPCAVRSSGGTACSDLLIASGVARVVAACSDPHPFAGGEGVERVRAAGVAVSMGLRRREAEELNAGFILVVHEGRPLVAIDSDPSSYDADVTFSADANLDLELRRLATAGLTRVRAAPGTPVADALRSAGLVDLEPEG